MNGTKMSRNKSPHTKLSQQVNKKNATSFSELNFGLDPSDTLNTQLSSAQGLGSLTKKIKVENKNGLSTPQCAPQSSKMGGPKGFTLENDSSTTPTLPQGAAAERQHHLQKKDVRRRLDMELAPDNTLSSLPTSTTNSDGFKTPKAKRARTKSVTSTTPSTPELGSPATPRSGRCSSSAAVDKSRFDSSLGLLTKRFLGLLQSAENGILDLNQASVTLAVQKRRIYDITNVLEGIGLLKKISKNNIQWNGTEQASSSQARQRDLNRDLALLEMKENQLDDLLSSTESSLRNLSEEKRYAYVTYNDLKSISEYNDNTVMAVRAPPETKLQVPHPSEGYQMYMKSEFGEIEVFLCPESSESDSSSSSSSPSTSPPSRHGGMLSPTTSNGAGRSLVRSHRTTRSQNQVLTQLVGGDEDDQDKSLLMETIDQNQQHRSLTSLHTPPKLPVSPMGSGMDMASASEPFLCLEPPLDESAYMFTMDDAEGLSNLFDFPF